MKKIWMMVWMGMCVIMLEAQSPVHVVKSGETLYSIARNYSVTLNELVKANPGLTTSTQVKVGQRLTIPGVAATTTTHTSARIPARLHSVTKGETVYSVAKKYGVTVSEIRQWNNLSDLSLKIGQKLVVSKADKQAMYQPINVASTPDTPYREEDPRPRNESLKANATTEQQEVVEKPKDMPVAEAKPVVIPTTLRTTSSNPTEYSGIFSQYSVNGYRIKKNRGAANYLSDNTSGNQFLAFYNDAETGSIIRVTNMMNRKTIYVKVMGKVPPADAGREIILKLGNTAAQELGVIDEKFLVEVASYQAQQ